MTLIRIALLGCVIGLSQAQAPVLRIEQVMTARELRDTGVANLTSEQRDNLNRWLLAYTVRVMNIKRPQEASPQPSRLGGTGCSPAIESTISGEFKGWDGETIFKLDNGQIWQQAEYDYMYSYSYRPEVTIYPTTAGCKLKVEDEAEAIVVRRLK